MSVTRPVCSCRINRWMRDYTSPFQRARVKYGNQHWDVMKCILAQDETGVQYNLSSIPASLQWGSNLGPIN